MVCSKFGRPAQSPATGAKKKAAHPGSWLGRRQRNSKSWLTMRWDVLKAASAPSCTCCAEVTAVPWVFMLRRDSGMSLSFLNRPGTGVVAAWRGHRYWPKKLAGDKGYSYVHVREWLKRHHIEPVIPTRKDRTPEPSFDKATYRQRNIIQRSLRWYKECRHLGTRYDKLAVNYVAYSMVAIIEKLLHHQ